MQWVEFEVLQFAELLQRGKKGPGKERRAPRAFVEEEEGGE